MTQEKIIITSTREGELKVEKKKRRMKYSSKVGGEGIELNKG